jgi:pyridoxamine 5'-phosphate oxidase
MSRFLKYSSWREALFVVFHPRVALRPPLELAHMSDDPYAQFARWYADAHRSLLLEFPNAMCLSTVDRTGAPDARMVLLKGFDERGFVFYTNCDSAKGRELAAHAEAAVTFYWTAAQRQVRIRGAVEKVDDAEADAYFASRPRGSQIGAWASQQSETLESRRHLEQRFEEFREKYADGEVPRPPYWSGYRIHPKEFEFWQLRVSRLHDRIAYRPDAGGGWVRLRLYP